MSAKSKDTTKTAHVMNLLRKNTGSTQTGEATVQEQNSTEHLDSAMASQPKPVPTQHPIITSLNEEAAVSQEIKDALEQELSDVSAKQERLLPSGEEPAAMQTQQSGDEPSEEKPSEDTNLPEMPDTTLPVPAWEEKAPVEGNFQEEENMPALSTNEAEATPVQLPAAGKEPIPNMEIYNVMQALVEESAEKYMTMFNLCTCPRCKADVRALALNNLQPKYVVMGEGEYIPRITVYERQFSATVTAQILRACTVVAENPRHDGLH